MTTVTKCPECRTRFKVSDEQLAAHDGLVRCGRCRHIFNASENLYDNEPSPQLNLPIEITADELPDAERSEPELIVADETTVADIDLPPLNTDLDQALSQTELDITTTQVDAPPDEVTQDPPLAVEATPILLEHDLTPIADVRGLEDQDAPVIEFAEADSAAVAQDEPRKRPWGSIAGVFLLIILLLLQATYFYRIQIASHLPGLKPLLLQACAPLECTVDLPKEIDLLTIESSELESDPTIVSQITLHALLHNRATYTQAFPNLELALTDVQDQVIARRIFTPNDYLSAPHQASSGFFSNRDLDIALHMDTADLKPAGYRLFLFYPQ
ncbi:MAG: DUF3426 domain-containing protein [Sideroxydans sp.]|nr:DUF3426 domain-containing protein [Sideroxydans sp.]